MPYLTDKRKKEIDADPKCELVSTGDLTYVLMQEALRCGNSIIDSTAFDRRVDLAISRFLPQVPRYADYSAVIGSLFCTAFELDRRGKSGLIVREYAEQYYKSVIAPYEDKKIAENGDVF